MNAAAVWAADRASAAPNWRRRSRISPKGANSVFDGAHAAAITEPHPRLSDCQPAGFQNARPNGPLLSVLGENPHRMPNLHDLSRLPRVLTVL